MKCIEFLHFILTPTYQNYALVVDIKYIYRNVDYFDDIVRLCWQLLHDVRSVPRNCCYRCRVQTDQIRCGRKEIVAGGVSVQYEIELTVTAKLQRKLD
jgi:hypothetical protein